MKNVMISADNLCKSFANNGQQNHVLHQLDLELYEGDFTVIMGPSGSGKSTLLYTISGMDSANSGHIMYQGADIAAMKEKQLSGLRQNDFGFVFQQMHLISNLTIYENVIISGFLNKQLKADEVEKNAVELLGRMGLKEQRKRLPSQVSGGEQQRAAIARAVIGNPKLLFADEPTGALNRKNTNEVLDLLSMLNQDGQSILMVTHDMRAALRANRILYLVDGRIVGTLDLPEFQKSEEKQREVQVNAWLSSLEW